MVYDARAVNIILMFLTLVMYVSAIVFTSLLTLTMEDYARRDRRLLAEFASLVLCLQSRTGVAHERQLHPLRFSRTFHPLQQS